MNKASERLIREQQEACKSARDGTVFKPGFYRQRNGEKAEILAVRGWLFGIDGDLSARIWSDTGRCHGEAYWLEPPWQEPVVGWVEVSDSNGVSFGPLYHTRTLADRYPETRTALLKLTWDGEMARVEVVT